MMTTNPVLAALAAAAAVAALITLPANAAPVSHAAAQAGHATQYAKVQRACGPAPRPGRSTCFAMKLVRVAEGTPGAVRMATVAPTYETGPAGGLAPSALAAAYGYDPTQALAKPQTVALVDAYKDPRVKADLNVFDAQYGLPAETASSFKVVNQSGNASPLPALPPANDDWTVEISLDVQAVRAVCNECKILLVEAKSTFNNDLAAGVRTAARLGATEISNSYGSPESAATPATIRKSYDKPGIVMTAATGDDGWYSWDRADNGRTGWSDNRPNTPAAFPTVVAVAGTKLALNDDGTRANETVWNENGLDDSVGITAGGVLHGARGASGGGCSFVYTAPAWQAAVAHYANAGCKPRKRLAGDVAALGDPNPGFDTYDSYKNQGWQTFGGTSLSSPLIAAMWALAGGAGSEKYPAKSLYDRLRYTAADSIFDVVTGGNSFCAGDVKSHCSSSLRARIAGVSNPNHLRNGNHHYANGWTGNLDCGYKTLGQSGTIANDRQCYARVGYDGPSGVGAPANLSLFVPTRITVRLSGPSPVKVHVSNQWSATSFKDGLVGATAVSYRWTWGDGTGTTKTTASALHKYGHTGVFKVTLTVSDSRGQMGTVSKSVKVTT